MLLPWKHILLEQSHDSFSWYTMSFTGLEPIFTLISQPRNSNSENYDTVVIFGLGLELLFLTRELFFIQNF